LATKNASEIMMTYNKRDVEVTELDYLDVRPHIRSHPHIGVIEGKPDVCKWCGKNEGFASNGYDYTKTATIRRFKCNNCRGNNRYRLTEKVERSLYA
jgi:hypothetical protein